MLTQSKKINSIPAENKTYSLLIFFFFLPLWIQSVDFRCPIVKKTAKHIHVYSEVRDSPSSFAINTTREIF